MFFIGIFGIERKEKEIKSWNTVCPECGSMSKASLYMIYTYFHIFFIPTVRWNRRYFLRLRCCGSSYEAPQEYARQLSDSDTIDFSRLKKTSAGSGFNNFYAKCAACGRNFDSSFPFCPYCGTKR